MARCVARYAVALLLDVVRFVSSWKDLVKRAKLVDPAFGLSATHLRNLLKLHKNTPRASSERKLYALLNKYLTRCRLRPIPLAIVELAVKSDSARATSEKDLKSFQNRELARQISVRVSKIRSEISMLLKRMEHEASTEHADKSISLLWLALMVFVDTCEIADLVGDEEHNDLVKASDLHRDSDREYSLAIGITALADAMLHVDALEADIKWHHEEPDLSKREPPTQKRLGTMRLLVEANRAITTAMSITPTARVGNERIRAVWTSEQPTVLWARTQPVSRTSRLLRNFIELAQYAGERDSLLTLWELLRGTEEGGFVKKGLSYSPQSWDLSIADDKLMCCAARVIGAYESKLANQPLLCEVDSYRLAVISAGRANGLFEELSPCKDTCPRHGLLCDRSSGVR